jgi:hypothetical protein
LLEEVLEVESQFLDGGGVLGFEAEVEEGVVEGSAHEELEGEVVGALGGFAGEVELGVVPVDLSIHAVDGNEGEGEKGYVRWSRRAKEGRGRRTTRPSRAERAVAW